MKLISIISIFILISCNTEPTDNSKQNQTNQKNNQNLMTGNQHGQSTCQVSSSTFVIFEEATNSLKYCDKGTWKEIPNEKNGEKKKELSRRLLPKHKIPSTHRLIEHENRVSIKEQVKSQKKELPIGNLTGTTSKKQIEKKLIKQKISKTNDNDSFHCRPSQMGGKKTFRCQRAH